MLIGYLLSNTFKIDVDVNDQTLNPFSIFFNNIKVAILSVLGTFFLGYSIFFVNSIFLGMSINYSLEVYSLSEILRLLGFHAPLELFCWLLTLQISFKLTQYFFVRKDVFPKKKTVALTISCYFVAALVESYVSRG